MGKFTKAIFIFFSSLLILIVAAVIIIPLFIDLNDYKPEIEAAVKDETGRTLSIRGDLSVSVFPWLGISTGEISLSNAAGFEEENFALIGESDIKVKLIPLFSRKVEVRTIVLKGLELNLAKNKQGISNWDDLIKPKEAQDQQEAIAKKEGNKAEPLISAFVIGGLELKDAQISWNDQQSAQRLVINDFNLSSSAVAFNEPIELKLSFLLKNPDTAASEQLALSTRLVVDETLQKIQLKSFKLDSTTKGESIPGGVFDAQLFTEVTLDLQQQTLALEKIQFNSNMIDLTGYLKASQLNAQLQYEGTIQIASFSPKALLQQLQMDVPETTDSQVLQKFVMGFSLQGTKDSVALNKLDITLDDTKIIGNIRVKQFKKPAITFNLAIDDIDVDRYSAPKKENAAPSPVATPASAVAKATTLIPVETIRALNLSGDLTIGSLKAANLKMKELSLNLKAKQGILRTKQSIKHLYKGHYKGKVTINAKSKTPTISLNEKISGVQLEPLLKDLQAESTAKLKGTANIAAELKARGNTLPAIKSSLGGKLRFSLHKGAIREFNLQKIIDVGKLAIKGKEMKKSYTHEQTVFSVIKGTATIKQGLINNPDFLAESSTVEVKGKGTVNLVNDALNYQLIAKVKPGSKKPKRIVDRPIAIKVAGTISEPSYKVDLSSLKSMLTEKEKKKVDKFINKGEKEIDKALGKGTGKAVNKLLNSFF